MLELKNKKDLEKGEKKMNEYLGILTKKITKIIALVVSNEKVDTASTLFENYADELEEQVRDKNRKEVEKEFGHYVANLMSIIETVGLNEKQFKSTRRLILNELYAYQDNILLPSIKDDGEGL